MIWSSNIFKKLKKEIIEAGNYNIYKLKFQVYKLQLDNLKKLFFTKAFLIIIQISNLS